MTLVENGGNAELANALGDLYAWQIDFFRIQKNDKFKVIYEELFVEDESVGIHKIISAEFEHFGEKFLAFNFHQGQDDYFDEKGESLRKAFLKAPLKYSRISSRYSLRRYHPVQKRYKAHLGTDYAAPRGTPVYAVGDGIVTEARYKKYNGNYVKIRHNSVYTTQYLHMQKIKSGIRPGKKVKQGDVIGYVGSTGLATGPHCCFRFWKNGQQVDPFRQKIPPSQPVAEENMKAFKRARRIQQRELDKLEYPKEDIYNWDSTNATITMQSSYKPYL
jgi:murein DD-endopeptidase MepM/ murein hydrolase activator NlpD